MENGDISRYLSRNPSVDRVRLVRIYSLSLRIYDDLNYLL